MAIQSSVNKTILPNGIRVVSERVPYVKSVSVGIWVEVGARDESKDRRGLSHFVEHMLFKGTQTRTARDIATQMDSLGGHLNAFTDKEFTCYYARVLAEHLPKALDIICDMVLNSAYDEAELAREKNVILEEIKRHEDTPEEQVHDLLAQTIWKGHRLGNSVIGSASVARNLTREELTAYVEEFYRPNALLVAAAGDVEHKALADFVGQAFGNLSGERPTRRDGKVTPCLEAKLRQKRTEQAHFCLGMVGYAQNETEKYALAAIDSILGGGMSSRLFQEIRENRGLAYAIGSYAASYREAGLFAIYGGTSVENVRNVLDLTRRECDSIRRDSVTEDELERAQNQIRGALVLGQESMSNRMSRLAKSELYFGRIIRSDEIIDSIMQVSRDDVAGTAAQVFNGSEFALAAIGPFGEDSDLLGAGG